MVATLNGTAKAEESQVVILPRLERQTLVVPIVGITPYIPHKWSIKATRLMREAQTEEPVQGKKQRELKNPAEEAEAHTYRLPDGRLACPATAFKAAIVGGARMFKGITLVIGKQTIFVAGEGPDQLVPIDGVAEMHEDMPRNANGNADLRYRNYIYPWRADLRVQFYPAHISAQSLINLIDASGGGGVGDWRPSAPKSLSGMYGRYELDMSRDVQIIGG